MEKVPFSGSLLGGNQHNYAIDKNWGVTFSVSYIPMKTDAKLTTTVNGNKVAVSKTRLTLDPIVPFLYVTYKF